MKYSEKMRKEIVEDFEKSGLSKKEYAKQHNMSYQAFYGLLVRGTIYSIGGYHIPRDKRKIRPPLSEEQKEKIFALYKENKNMRWVANKLGVPDHQVRYLIKGPSGVNKTSRERQYELNKRYFDRRREFCLEERRRVNHKGRY